MNTAKPERRTAIIKHLKTIVKIAFTVVFIYYLFDIIYTNYNQILEKNRILNPLIMGIVIIQYLLWLFFFEYVWEFALRKLFVSNVEVPRINSAMAFARSLLYRYIPGKIWFIGARTEFLKKFGITRSHVLNATFIEQLNFFIIPIFLFCLMYSFLGTAMPPAFPLYTCRIVFFAVLTGILLWLFLPFYFSRFLKKWSTRLNISQNFINEIKSPAAWLLFVSLFFLLTTFQGAASIPVVTAFIDSSGTLTMPQWAYLIAAYPFARVIGQLGIIAPSGLGVREGAYIFLTSPVIGIETSALVSIWFRFLTILAEVIFFLIILIRSMKTEPEKL